MPRKIPYELVQEFDSVSEFEEWRKVQEATWSIMNTTKSRCTLCAGICEPHDMRTTYAFCNNDDCLAQSSSTSAEKRCQCVYKVITCTQTQRVQFYRHGEHTGTEFRPKQHGMSKKVIDLIEQLIESTPPKEIKPKRIFFEIQKPQYQQLVDCLPSLDQVRNFLRNRRTRRPNQPSSSGTRLSLSLNNLLGGNLMAAQNNTDFNDIDDFDDDELLEFDDELAMDKSEEAANEQQQNESSNQEWRQQDVDDEEEKELEEKQGGEAEMNDEEGDEDDDEEEDDADEMLDDDEDYEKQVGELEKAIAETPMPYVQFEEAIRFTRTHGDLNRCRDLRERMNEMFPLGENIWLDWLKDEQKYVESDLDRARVEKLFQRAVQDYLSVPIWLEYIQFSIGGMGEENGIENIRSICEKACSFAGLHVTKGYLLWEAYREFETAILAGYQQSCAASVQTPEQAEKIKKQIERITRIFETQLSVCLDNLESTYDELKQFDEEKANELRLKQNYEEAIKKFTQIEPFENELSNCDEAFDINAKIQAYLKYLDFEIKQVKDLENAKVVNNDKLNKQRLRVKCLFERAVGDQTLCLSSQLWTKYINFCNEENSEETREYNTKVYGRAVRNVTSSSRLWINYALALEKNANSDAEIKKVFNDAMNSSLETSEDYLKLWHAYLDYLRRSMLVNYERESDESKKETVAETLRETFQKAINQLYEYFNISGDPTFSLEKYWAHVEAKYFGNMEKARKIYNEMILDKSQLGKYSSAIWLEFIELESRYGDEKHERKLLTRAINELTDDDEREVIYDAAVRFEKLNGTVGQFVSVYNRSEAFKAQREVDKAKKAAAEQEKRTQDNKKPSGANKAAPKQPKQQQQAKKSSDDSTATNTSLKRKTPETTSPTENGSSKAAQKDKDGFAIPSLPVSSVETPQKKPKSNNEASSTFAVPKQPPLPVDTSGKKFDSMKRDLTVFISNLSYDVDQAKVRAVFEKEPGFKELRLINHWNGKTKGYGYVDFERSDQAANALKLDRTPIDGRPMFVSKNEDKSLDIGQKQFKYNTGLEKTKLFVKGLPFSFEKDQVENIFKAFGKLREVRIVQYRNGRSKGLAYVEFEDEPSASKALMQTDGMLVGEENHQISVAISNPPKRNKPEDDVNEDKQQKLTRSLGSGSVTSRTASQQSASDNTASTAAKTSAFSFVPRSQQLMGRKTKLNLN